MQPSSLRRITLITGLTAALGVLLVIAGIVSAATSDGGDAGLAYLGAAVLGLALMLYVVWLAVDAIVEALTEVRDAAAGVGFTASRSDR
jgi:hypothetical protein